MKMGYLVVLIASDSLRLYWSRWCVSSCSFASVHSAFHMPCAENVSFVTSWRSAICCHEVKDETATSGKKEIGTGLRLLR